MRGIKLKLSETLHFGQAINVNVYCEFLHAPLTYYSLFAMSYLRRFSKSEFSAFSTSFMHLADAVTFVYHQQTFEV